MRSRKQAWHFAPPSALPPAVITDLKTTRGDHRRPPTQHNTAGARVALSSHLGRPKDGPEDKFSLGPVAERLTELLGKECKMAPDCVGDEVAEIANGLGDGDVMLLENVRFYPAETKNDAGEPHGQALIFIKIDRFVCALMT